jgi:hypothetical protein
LRPIITEAALGIQPPAHLERTWMASAWLATADNGGDTMRQLLALLLTAACCEVQAKADAPAAGLPPCDKAVRFSAAWFPDPEVDNSKSTAELATMDSKGKAAGVPLGHVVVETKLTVAAQTMCQGVVVRLDYGKPVLRVAKEIPPDSCAYARVMNHEQTHVRIHREIAQQFRALEYPWRATESKAILTFAKQELDRLMQAQVQFDSPEEYAKNDTICGGEIARLIKPSAVARSGK